MGVTCEKEFTLKIRDPLWELFNWSTPSIFGANEVTHTDVNSITTSNASALAGNWSVFSTGFNPPPPGPQGSGSAAVRGTLIYVNVDAPKNCRMILTVNQVDVPFTVSTNGLHLIVNGVTLAALDSRFITGQNFDFVLPTGSNTIRIEMTVSINMFITDPNPHTFDISGEFVTLS